MSESLPTLDDYLQTDPRDREPDGPRNPPTYVCVARGCGWQGKGALDHHRATGHAIRLRHAEQMGDQIFPCCAAGACAVRKQGAA